MPFLSFLDNCLLQKNSEKQAFVCFCFHCDAVVRGNNFLFSASVCEAQLASYTILQQKSGYTFFSFRKAKIFQGQIRLVDILCQTVDAKWAIAGFLSFSFVNYGLLVYRNLSIFFEIMISV